MTLRIQRSVESDLVVFKLTGRIQAADVPELVTLFLKSDESWGGRGIVLDLEQVKLVDRDAVFFLALSEMTGAKLRNCSPYIREWITQEISAMNRNKTEDPTGFEG
jgi:anti-anti-sigma regulatory factor